jgi:hypothetical protein
MARQLSRNDEVGRVSWILAPGVRNRMKRAAEGDPVGALGQPRSPTGTVPLAPVRLPAGAHGATRGIPEHIAGTQFSAAAQLLLCSAGPCEYIVKPPAADPGMGRFRWFWGGQLAA